MLKAKPLSAVQKERLMEHLPILRKLNDNGLDIIGFNVTGCELEIWAKDKRPGRDETVFPFTMYTEDPYFYYNDVHQNQQEP